MAAKVQVLLSTYNGIKFLSQQLESIKLQKDVHVKVLVRDDGSADGTYEFLLDAKKSWPQLEVLERSQNIGVIDSFFKLISDADLDFEYFAFCDQDDVWNQGKLSSAALTLKDYSDVPALYFSRLQYVDSNLNYKGLSPKPKYISLNSALIENVATGCTVVFNKALIKKLQQKLPTSNSCLMHDWWLYLVALGLGKVVYDPSVTVRYRQHGENVVGGTSSVLRLYFRKIKRFLSQRVGAVTLSKQAQAYLDFCKHDLSADNLRLIGDFVNSRNQGFVGRLIYAAQTPLRRQSRLDTLIFKLLIVLRRY